MSTQSKYGSAVNLGFGTATVTGFTIVESISSDGSYNNEITVKDKDGDTTGLILADKRYTVTISGMTSSSPSTLGAVLSADPTSLSTGSLICTGVRANWSNEDFQKYECTYTSYDGITVSGGGGGGS